MNLRIATVIVGIITVALGLLALAFPEFAMKHLLGFAVDPSYSVNAVHSEVRATYGGLFVVMGFFTLLAALDPVAHRARLLFIGFLWLGTGAGRLLGVWLDGNPGLPGWVAVAFEALMGGALVAAAVIKPPTTASVTTPFQPTPPPQP
jgi:hypothetical protein